MSRFVLVAGLLLLGPPPALAQDAAPCRAICAPEFKVEPTITFETLFNSPRIVVDDGTPEREHRKTDFEVVLSIDLSTRIRWFELTVEAAFLPFEGDSTPDLEFEANFVWLPSSRTRDWVVSHFDVVDQFSPAERADDRRAYTHKLNFELDTSVAVFNWLPEGRWLRGVEVEGSLDYVATGLPRTGDVIDGRRFVDKASPWSFSIVFVLPIAPM